MGGITLIELTKEEYTDVFACLDKTKIRVYDTSDGVETYIKETDTLILVRRHPYQDPAKNYTNSEPTLYQMNLIPKSITTVPEPVQKIVLNNWKDLQFVIDLLRKDKDERLTDGTAN